MGSCDGKNPVDGNQIPAGQKGAGYPAMGQPGRGTDADGDGVFEPSPCYAWNNTLNGAKLNMAHAPLGSERDASCRRSTSRKGGISSTRSPSPSITSPTSIRIRCKANNVGVFPPVGSGGKGEWIRIKSMAFEK